MGNSGIENPSLSRIAAKWLRTNGFKGLCNLRMGCGCRLADLMPCDAPDSNCRAGHAHNCTCGGKHKFCIVIRRDMTCAELDEEE